MDRLVIVCVGLLLWCASAGGAVEPEVGEGPRLAVHLIATYDYPACSDMIPSSVDHVRTELTREELAASKGFGYACFLVRGVEGLTGVEFALGGLPDARSFKAGRIEWCSEGALTLGDFRGSGGIAAFPCLECFEGDPFIAVGYLPFEYRGERDIRLTLEPSSFSKPDDPMMYILDCSMEYEEHEVVGSAGAVIEGTGPEPDALARRLAGGRLMWTMGVTGTLEINQFAPGNQFPGEPAVEMSFPLVVVDGFLAAVDPQGEILGELEQKGSQWVLPSGNSNRALRMTRAQEGSGGGMTPWDLNLMEVSGDVIWEKEHAGQRAWISPDGLSVAWQRLGHAGRVKEKVHVWKQGMGEIDVPKIGFRDVVFLDSGALVGWGKVLEAGALDAEVGQWGVVCLAPDGEPDWFAPIPESTTGGLAASAGGVALARVREGGGLVVDGWSASGEAVFADSRVSDNRGTGGRVAAAVSADGGRIVVAWAPRRDGAYVLAGLDGRSGRVNWRRNPNQDISEEGMSPDKIVFSADDSTIGLSSFRVAWPPAFGVSIYDREGTLVWQRRKTDCAGISQDLRLSASGDQILIVVCGRAYVYQLDAL